jgi:hypothetical protein
VKSSGIGTRPGTGFRAVPISENASAQQAATLAVFKSPGFRPVCRKTKLDLVILWEYYLAVIPPKNDTSFWNRKNYPK